MGFGASGEFMYELLRNNVFCISYSDSRALPQLGDLKSLRGTGGIGGGSILEDQGRRWFYRNIDTVGTQLLMLLRRRKKKNDRIFNWLGCDFSGGVKKNGTSAAVIKGFSHD